MEDTELEEGEACYYKDDTSVDPDIALSYLVETTYTSGLFLSEYGREFGEVDKSNCNPALQVLTLLSLAALHLNKLHAARASSGDISAKQNSCLSSAVVIEKFPMKHEPVLIKPVNPTDQRTLKVRIRVVLVTEQGKMLQSIVALGLFLHHRQWGTVLMRAVGCHLNAKRTCMNLFTEYFRQEHAVALADDSASLMGVSKVSKDKKAKIVEKSDNLIVLKQELGMDFDDKRTTIVKCEVDIEVRNMGNESLGQKGCFSNDTKPKRISNSVCNVVDSVKGAAMAPGIPREAGRNISLKKREVTKDGMEDRLSTRLVKESESLSDQKDGELSSTDTDTGHDMDTRTRNFSKNEGHDTLGTHGEYEKAEQRTRSSSMEKICESRIKNDHRNVSTDLREDVQSKGNKVSDPLKADTDVSKCRRDHNVGAMDHSRYKVGQTTTYHEQVEAKMPRGMVKSSFESKNKSKGSQSNGKSASEADESLMTRSYEVPKEKKKAAKMHNSKSPKDIQNVDDNCKDLLPKTRVEQMNNQINSLERPFGDRPKRSNPEAVEKEHCRNSHKQFFHHLF
ncbi:unnamed protein product [Camellia sinensis]